VNSLNKTERFQKIIQDNKGILYKVINIYCKDIEDKKDLEQEILIQLWSSLKSYNENYKLSTWIYKIAMNVSISFYRKNKLRNTTTHLPIDSIFIEGEYDEDTDEFKHQKKVLNIFIDKLNEFDKAIIILYMEEYNYKEISDIVGISETNVGTKINRIKKKLKGKIK